MANPPAADPVGAMELSLSVVSHGHGEMIAQLFADLEQLDQDVRFEVILTVNSPEPTDYFGNRGFPLKVIANDSPRGFGANHNAAFRASKGRYFAVVNPDIRLPPLQLQSLCGLLREDKSIGAVGPAVRSSQGVVQDNARRFPNVSRLLRRAISGSRVPDYPVTGGPIIVDWLAGMFVIFRRDAFSQVGGFDERYFMYFEDVDICSRLWSNGWSVVFQPDSSVIHDAQRASHRQFRHLYWHLASAVRYFILDLSTRSDQELTCSRRPPRNVIGKP